DVSHWGALATAAKQQGLVYTERTVDEIRGLGRRALGLRCDVADRGQVEETVARVAADLGGIDILVNNAGTLDHVAQFHEQSSDLASYITGVGLNVSGGIELFTF